MSEHAPKRRGPMGGHGPMGGMHMAGEKAKDFKGSFKKLLKYLGKYRVAIVIVMIFAIASAAFMVLGPKILGKAITEMMNGLIAKVTGVEGGGINFGRIGEILLFMLGLYVLSAAFSFIQGFIMTGVSQKVAYNMRRELSEKIGRLPMKYFDSRTHGEVLSRVTNDVDTLSQSLNQSLTQIITAVTTIIGVLIMMLTISWLMTLITFIILPISLGLIGLIMKKSQKYFQAQQEYLGHINGQVEEVYGGHNIVKAFNNEKSVTDTFNETNDTLYHSAWKSQFLSGMMMPIMTFVGNLGYVAVSILGGWLAIKKVIEVGDIVSFSQYIRNFTQPLTQVAQVGNLLQSTMAAAERVFEFLDEEEEDQTVENPVSLDGLDGSVQFAHVHFGYNPDKIIINDFSASVKAGQKVAIVGPTGAGKTTMVNLLMRFYEISGGTISIDGIDTKSVPRWNVHDQFSMVLQDTWMFRGTVRENIAYSKKDVTDEQIVAACKAVGLHHYIMSLPNGYDTVLDDKASLSQGQRQLLTIARAMVEDAPILILDEATSSVDTRTEELIQKAMDALTVGRTSFVIAHRLSTIRDADMILVMNGGDIVERGTHEELLAKGGFYADIYNSQFTLAE